jgi:CRP/FNR family cyclic AMP-dependent transcriptional regulator
MLAAMTQVDQTGGLQPDELHVPSGTTIFREGDPGDSMFLIEQGRVRIRFSLDVAPEVAVFGPGEFFGELSLLCGAPRTATAETIEDTTLVVVRRDTFAMIMQDDVDIVFHMLSDMGTRLVRSDQRFRELMHRLGRTRVAAECVRRATRSEGALPVAVDLERVAEEAGMALDQVRAAAAELAAQGAGLLSGAGLLLESREQIGRLADALCAGALCPGATAAGTTGASAAVNPIQDSS